MFYIDNGLVRLTRDNIVVCEVTDIDRAIHELSLLKNASRVGVEEEAIEDRFTVEGIDRHFEASCGFVVRPEIWREDALRNWEHLSGPELFNRYQSHAETYCWGCRDIGIEPTYQGFREWMMRLRDLNDEDNPFG